MIGDPSEPSCETLSYERIVDTVLMSVQNLLMLQYIACPA